MATKNHRVNWRLDAQDNASKAFKNLRNSFKELGGATSTLKRELATLVGGVSIGLFARELIRESTEAEKASNRLSAVIRATGASAKFSKAEMDELANSMQATFGVSDESVRNAQGNLLKFGNIQGEVFREALKLSADLAHFMGTDIADAAHGIGRSLQSPAEGLRALEQQFGKLTIEQEKNIKNLIEQNRVYEAQQAILDIWREKIGGTAELMNTGLTKATADVANAWSDFLEELSKTDLIGGGALKILEGITAALEKMRVLMAGQPATQLALQTVQKELDALDKKIANQELAIENERRLAEVGRRTRLHTQQSENEALDIQQRRLNLLAEQAAKLREQRNELVALIDSQREQADFERSLANAPLRPVVAGGGSDAAALKAAEEERKRRAEGAANFIRSFTEEQVAGAQAIVEANEDIITTYDSFGNQLRVTREEYASMTKAAEEAARALSGFTFQELIDGAQEAVEAAEELVYTWDELGNRVTISRKEWDEMNKNEIKRTQELVRDLGLTFSSAFEEAIIQGKSLRDVLKGIAQDIARLIIRRGITEPLLGGLSGLFGGGVQNGGFAFASGGRPPVGQVSLVGERGPELFVPDTSGTIMPNGSFGGVTINSPITITGAGVSMADVRMALAAQQRQTIAAVSEMKRR